MTKASPATAPAPKEAKTIKVDIHPNWIHLIRYCGTSYQTGQLTLRIEGGIPVRRMIVGTKKDIRFGKKQIPPLFFKDTGNVTNCRVTRKWNDLINLCKNQVPYGQVCFALSAGEPIHLVEKFSAHAIEFGHPETIPNHLIIFNEFGS